MWSLVVHGGSGVIDRADLTPEQDRAYRAALVQAAEAGAAVLRGSGSALDAVEAAVRVLEDDPLFNAGRGAVYTAEGRAELDAAIMDGATLGAGAVAGSTRTRHPISLARAVMAHSAHVLLGGEGADAFAASRGLEQVDPAWFFVERRWRALERHLAREGLPIPPRPKGVRPDAAVAALAHDEGKRGTVGAVACDGRGHVAAATSTGGTTGKRWGRVGDSPLIGAGTYASDRAAAVSGTGEGEYFIRLAVAHRICALVELSGFSLQAACDRVMQQDLTGLGGQGGVIATAPSGEMAWSFNTSGMYRARIAEARPLEVAIYKDEA
ncbi:MAG: isoaspartyl peptidase/L-asparaginase family protein [Phenylobacterium sp.]